jgi:cell wall-associated NlpC family hydrolase
MDKIDQDVIESLSEPAKKMFRSLDKSSQRRMLKQAREMAQLKVKKRKQKGKVIQKSIGKVETKKKENRKMEYRASGQRNAGFRVVSNVTTITKEAMLTSMHFLLLGENASEDTYHNDSSSERGHPSDVPNRVTRHSTRKTGSAIRNSISRNAMKRKARKQAIKAGNKSAQSAVKGVQKAAQGAAKMIGTAIQAIVANPIVWLVLVIVLLIAIVAGVIAMMIGSGGAANNTDSSTYQAQVSEKTEGYRTLVEQYCEKYEIDDYVDLCLAMIEQESGGNPPDVMQTAQSYYNTNPPIDTAEESIDCGTHELADCLEKAKCKDAGDVSAISLAIQGYNFGNGYIEWAIKNYKGYTKENAEIFSKKMCNELGYSSYGDTDYVSHVLRYYIANPETTVSNASAKSILKELKENNEASEDIWKVIEKGASLIGSVEYSMDKRQGDGRDNPEFLDCSSFTAWAFHKAGITSVGYGSTTASFISSNKFVDIDAGDLKPGDIGLKSKTGATGGANHVGIYCGKLKNGTKVWLHCTSSSGTSLTSNTSGSMFGAYTNFTYFRRLKKWNK